MRALIMILSLSCSSAWADDWTVVPLGTSSDLYAIENMVLGNTWVVGANGFAARSNDTRTAWTTMDPGTEANLYSVCEPGAFEVYMGAGEGVVRLRVYNGWFERDIPSASDFRLFTRQGAKCFAIGLDGQIFRTTNFGNTWSLLPSVTTATLNAGSGSPDGPAWVVGDNGTILRTVDGTMWTHVETGTNVDLYGIAELDLMNLYVVGEGGTILRSTDAGLSWTPQSSGTTQTLRAISISEANSSRLIAVGLGGTVLRSTDSGNSWCYLNVTTTDLYAAEAVNNTEFFVGGAGGLLLRTTNGGGSCVAATGVELRSPSTLSMIGPYPQPSTDVALLRVSVDRGRSFRTDVFDPSGRLVLALPEWRSASAGESVMALDTGDLAAGVYVIRVRSDGFQTSRRLVITR